MIKVFNINSVDWKNGEIIPTFRNKFSSLNKEYFIEDAIYVVKTNRVNFIITAKYNNDEDFVIVRCRAKDEDIKHKITLHSQMMNKIVPNSISCKTFEQRLVVLLNTLIFDFNVEYISVEVTLDPEEAYKAYSSKIINFDNCFMIDQVNVNKIQQEEFSTVVVDKDVKFNENQLLNFLEDNNLDADNYLSLFESVNTVSTDQYITVPYGTLFSLDMTKAAKDMGDLKVYYDESYNVVFESSDIKIVNIVFIPSLYKSLRLI